MARKIQTSLGLSERTKKILDALSEQNGVSNNEFIESLILSLLDKQKEIWIDCEDVTLLAETGKDGTLSKIKLWEQGSGSIFLELQDSWGLKKRDRLIAILTDLAKLYVEE